MSINVKIVGKWFAQNAKGLVAQNAIRQMEPFQTIAKRLEELLETSLFSPTTRLCYT